MATRSETPLHPLVQRSLDERRDVLWAGSPDKRWLAFCGQRSLATVAEIARESRNLGSHRIDVTTHGPHGGTLIDRLRIFDLGTGVSREISLPIDASIWPIGFSADSRLFGLLLLSGAAVRLAWIVPEEGVLRVGKDRRVNAAVLNADLSFPRTATQKVATWCGRTPSIVSLFVPDQSTDRLLEREGLVAFDSANVPEGFSYAIAGRTRHSDAFWSHLISQVGTFDTGNGRLSTIGEPDWFESVSASPNGSYLLVKRFCDGARWRRGIWRTDKDVEIWNLATGDIHRLGVEPGVHKAINRLPTAYGWRWHPLSESRLVWVQNDGVSTDLLVASDPPFNEPVSLVATASNACLGFDWSESGTLLIWEKVEGVPDVRVVACTAGGLTEVCCFAAANAAGQLTFNDVQTERFETVLVSSVTKPLIAEADGCVYLTATGATSSHNDSRLDRVCIGSGRRTSLIADQSGESSEWIQAILSHMPLRVLSIVEDSRLAPTFCIRHPGSNSCLFTSSAKQFDMGRALTKTTLSFSHPYGAELQASVEWPDNRGISSAGLPALVWIWPRFVAKLEGGGLPPRRGAYRRLDGVLPTAIVPHGYVAVYPDVPIAETPGAMFKCFKEQLVGILTDLIQVLTADGAIDANRVAIGGECFGAYSAAVALAHMRLFSAGICCNGIYNLSSSPAGRLTDGFMACEAPDLYVAASPLFSASQISSPVLLIQAAEPHFTSGSETEAIRMFEALALSGTPSRYVRLPHEGRKIKGRESVMEVADEMLQWCDRWLTPVGDTAGPVSLEHSRNCSDQPTNTFTELSCVDSNKDERHA